VGTTKNTKSTKNVVFFKSFVVKFQEI